MPIQAVKVFYLTVLTLFMEKINPVNDELMN